MGEVVSLLLFVFLTFITLWYAIGKTKIMRSPFNDTQQIYLSGEEYSVVLMFATALLACGVFLSTRLLINEFLCVVMLFLSKGSKKYSLPIKVYCIYMIWLVIGCMYSNYPVFGLRVIIKYIYPLLLVITCSRVVHNHELAITIGVLARKVGVLAAILGIFSFIEDILIMGVIWCGTARAINFISLMIFSLAMFSHIEKDKKNNLLLAILFIIPCVLWHFRTSIMGSLVALAVFSLFKYKIKAVPILALLCGLGIACVFMIPSLKEKMFVDKNMSIETIEKNGFETEQINTNGRTAIWEYLERKFNKGREWTGSGTGSVQREMYTNSEFYGGLQVPHSDYVQMLCDNGLIGMILYLLAMGMIIIHCFMIYNNKRHNTYIRICAITAGCALAGVLATMYSDNTVNYSMCTLSFPVGFYGMTLGLIYAEKDKNN